MVLEKMILKNYSIYSYVKFDPLVALPTPEGHDFHNFESTLPEEASTKFQLSWSNGS